MTVPSEFPAKTPCKLAFVAEAPGAEEVAEGRPLIGPSGRVYNALLRTAGIDRAEVFTGNVFDEKAPGNNVGPWMRDPAIFNPALARLEAEITKADPTVIVPMGAPALWAFTGRDDISSFRGTVSLAEIVAKGRKILPTFHPAFVMRQWKFYTVVAQDFMRAQEEANMGPHIVLPKKRLIVEPTLPEVEAWCERCLAEPGPLSVDIETGWGQITCIGIAPNAEEALCIPFVDLRLPNRSYWDTAQEEATAWRAVQKVLESPVPKLGQNYGGYDAFMLLEVQGVRTMNFSEDTRLLHHNLYPELPKDLAFMGASYTRQGAWKHWGWRGRNKRDD